MRSLPATALLGLALALTACGGDDGREKAEDQAVEKALESQDGVEDVEIDGDKFTAETEEGTISGGSGTDLPDGFPEDIPLPSVEYDIISAVDQDGEYALVATITGDLDLAAEKESMVAALTEAGYTIEAENLIDEADLEAVQLSATGNSWNVAINLLVDGEEATASYAVSPL